MDVFKFIKRFSNIKVAPEKITITEYDIFINSIRMNSDTQKIIHECLSEKLSAKSNSGKHTVKFQAGGETTEYPRRLSSRVLQSCGASRIYYRKVLYITIYISLYVNIHGIYQCRAQMNFFYNLQQAYLKILTPMNHSELLLYFTKHITNNTLNKLYNVSDSLRV